MSDQIRHIVMVTVTSLFKTFTPYFDISLGYISFEYVSKTTIWCLGNKGGELISSCSIQKFCLKSIPIRLLHLIGKKLRNL